ncbi:phage tail tape measure protein, partial [Pseudomonas moraviensis]
MTQTSRLVIELDSRDAEQKATDVRKALGALEDAGLSIKPAMDKARDGMESMGKGAEKASKSIEDEREEIEQLLSSIDPLTRKMNELEKQELALAKARKSGKIDLDTYNDYQDKLKSTRSALTGFNSDLNKTGMSAKATAAALRGVPAQFTDIATSLQGGQAPLTVFLQQGGQLKDMFGGAGPAAKALGGYVLGLINPLTVAAAAIGTLGVAYYQGSKEADAYRLSIVTTGNAAGTTTDALASMAVRIGSTVGTTGEAAAALALLASNGKIASDGFEQIATSAISFERATGKAVSDTVSEFAALADDPVKAVAALNEKYNFLTASVYEQIRAAQDMGEKEAAASIAQEAYAKALDARSKTMRDSLGIVEKAWGGITKAAKDSWDAMLGVGRTQSLDEQIANTKQLLADRKDSFVSKLFPDDLGQNSQSTKFLEQRLKLLEQQREVLVDQGKAEGENARIQREGLAAYDGFQKSIEGNFSKTQKMNKALEDEEKRIAAARLAGYTITAEQEAAAYKAIRENSTYKEAAAKKEKAYTEDAGTKALDQAKQQYAVLMEQSSLIDQQGVGTKALGAAAKDLIEWEQQLANIKTKQTLTADQQSLLAKADQITAVKTQSAEQEKLNALKKEELETSAKLLAFQENLTNQLNLSREGLSNELAGIGMGQKGRERLREDLKIRQDYQKQLTKLTYDYNKIVNPTSADTELYDRETQSIKDALDIRLGDQEQFYKDLDRAQADWSNGANDAWHDYVDEAGNIAGQTYDLFDNAFRGMEDSLVDFVTGGKLSFKDLADSIIADIARIIIKTQVVTPLLNSLFGGGAGAGGGGGIASLFSGSSSNGSGGGGLFS